MKKLKKIYCRVSFAFGMVMLALVLFLSFRQDAYATNPANPTEESVQDLRQTTPPNIEPA